MPRQSFTANPQQLRLLIKLNNQLARCPQSISRKESRKTHWWTNKKYPVGKHFKAKENKSFLWWCNIPHTLYTGYALRPLVIMRKENARSFCFGSYNKNVTRREKRKGKGEVALCATTKGMINYRHFVSTKCAWNARQIFDAALKLAKAQSG